MHSQFASILEAFKGEVNQLNHLSATEHHPSITQLASEANAVLERISGLIQQNPSDQFPLTELLAQTNLLALNLALEAARIGGEAGQSLARTAENFRKITVELRRKEHPNAKTSAKTKPVDAGQNWLRRLFRF